MFCGEKLQTKKCKNVDCFLGKYLFMAVPKSPMRKKKSEEDKKTLAELSSAYRCLQLSKMSVSANQLHYTKKIFLACHIINMLLTDKGGLYGKIVTSVLCIGLTAFGLYLRPRSRFSHTDLLFG